MKTNNKIRAITIISVLLITLILLSIPNIMCNIGRNRLNNKEPVKAYKILKYAYILRPKNKEIRYYYVKSMSKLKPTEKIQIDIFKFSQSSTKDKAQKLAKTQVEQWRNNILTNIGENYIEQAPDKYLIRWDVNTFPLRVKIEVPISTPDYYRAEIEKAFTQWSLSSGFLKFEFVENGDAEIIVKFNPLPEDVCNGGDCKYVVAYTNPKFKGRILKSMTITMYDKDANGNYFSDKELYNTILHEIGHALGIMGHSYSVDDLMYMSSQPERTYTLYRRDFQYISAKDLNTINLLYKLIPDMSNVAMSKFNKEGLIYAPIVLGNAREISYRKIREAEHYIQEAPDLPGGYIDLAIAYANLNKYTQAIETLHKALEIAKSNEDRYLIYYNIAVVHLNSNHLEEAQRYINIAKEINNNDEIAELQSNLNHAKAAKKKPFRTGLSTGE